MSEHSYREKFYTFLQQYQQDRADELLSRFEDYLELLYAQNQMVNMVSRQTPKDDYWLYHFLDSLLVLKVMDLQAEAALDFGSGGGLPGIPIKLVFPELTMTLLDSVGKKVKCLQSIIAQLELKNCTAIWARLEDYTKVFSGKRFDYILCRSVRLEESYIEPMCKLLKPKGKAVFYKAHQIEDVTVLPDIDIDDVSLEALGKRQIISVVRSSFEQYLKNKKLG